MQRSPTSPTGRREARRYRARGAERRLWQARPAVILQDDLWTLAGGLGSSVVCPLTSHNTGARSFRVAIEPSSDNGLMSASEVTVEKLAGVSVNRLREVIGNVDPVAMLDIERALLLVLGFASRPAAAPG